MYNLLSTLLCLCYLNVILAAPTPTPNPKLNLGGLIKSLPKNLTDLKNRNHVRNGGFEDDGIAPWSTLGSVSVKSYSNTTLKPRLLLKSEKFVSINAQGAISQTLKVKKGTSYLVTFSVNQEPECHKGKIELGSVSFADVKSQTFKGKGNGKWKAVFFFFTPKQDSDLDSLVITSTAPLDCPLALDNVRFSENYFKKAVNGAIDLVEDALGLPIPINV